jgi:hypothetical protein
VIIQDAFIADLTASNAFIVHSGLIASSKQLYRCLLEANPQNQSSPLHNKIPKLKQIPSAQLAKTFSSEMQSLIKM